MKLTGTNAGIRMTGRSQRLAVVGRSSPANYSPYSINHLARDTVRFGNQETGETDIYAKVGKQLATWLDDKPHTHFTKFASDQFKKEVAQLIEPLPDTDRIQILEMFNQVIQYHSDIRCRKSNLESGMRSLVNSIKGITNETIRFEVYSTLIHSFAAYYSEQMVPLAQTFTELALRDKAIEVAAGSKVTNCQKAALELIPTMQDPAKQRNLLTLLSLDQSPAVREKAIALLKNEAPHKAEAPTSVVTYHQDVYQAITMMKDVWSYRQLQGSLKDKLSEAIQHINAKPVRDALLNVYDKIVPFYTLSDITSNHNIQLAEAIASIPEPVIRTYTIETLLKAHMHDIRRATAHAIPTIPDLKKRDACITIIASDPHWFNLRVAKQLLPYCSNEPMQKSLQGRLGSTPAGDSPLFFIAQTEPYQIKAVVQNPMALSSVTTAEKAASQEPLSAYDDHLSLRTLEDAQLFQLSYQVSDLHRTLYRHNPVIRQLMKDTHPTEDSLPTGADIQKRYQRLATDYVKKQKGLFGRLIWRKKDAQKAQEITRLLLEIALETGNAMLPDMVDMEQVGRLVTIHKQVNQIKQEINRLHKLQQGQLLTKTHTDISYQQQLSKLTQMVNALKETGQTDQTALEQAKQETRSLQERRETCDAAWDTMQQQISQIEHQMTMLYRRLINGVLYATIESSKSQIEKAQKRLDKLIHQPDLEKYLEQAESMRYQTMAESQREQAKQHTRQTIQQLLDDNTAALPETAKPQEKTKGNTA